MVLTVTVLVCAALCFYLCNKKLGNQNIEQPKISRAMKALTFWTKIRAHPKKDITGSLPDVPPLEFCVNPINSNHIYMGNDLGVYVSTDAGTTWATLQALYFLLVHLTATI